MRLVVVEVKLLDGSFSSNENERRTNPAKLKLRILITTLLALGIGQNVIDESARLFLAKLRQTVASESSVRTFRANVSNLAHVCGMPQNC